MWNSYVLNLIFNSHNDSFLGLSVLLDQLEYVVHIVAAAEEDRASLMKLLWWDVQNGLPERCGVQLNVGTFNVVIPFAGITYSLSLWNLQSGACNSSSLFDDVSHGHTLVQDSQLAVGVGCWGTTRYIGQVLEEQIWTQTEPWRGSNKRRHLNKPVAGYIKIPPHFSVRWTSATIDPMYLKKGNNLAF